MKCALINLNWHIFEPPLQALQPKTAKISPPGYCMLNVGDSIVNSNTANKYFLPIKTTFYTSYPLVEKMYVKAEGDIADPKNYNIYVFY